jgi:hypothetical protein
MADAIPTGDVAMPAPEVIKAAETTPVAASSSGLDLEDAATMQKAARQSSFCDRLYTRKLIHFSSRVLLCRLELAVRQVGRSAVPIA